MSARLCVLAAVGGSVCACALAAPPHLVKHDGRAKTAPSAPGAIDNPFSDDFDSYVAGSGVAGQGPWSLWDPIAPDAWVDDQISFSAPHSMRLEPGSDVVTEMNLTSGQWRLTMQTWVPSGILGIGYVIGLNTYAFPSGPYHWSMDLQFNATTGLVGLWPDPNPPLPLAIITDQWVELMVEVDLDNDMYNLWYGGQHMVVDRPWSTGYTTGGSPQVRIQAFDWYSDSISGMRFDNIVFEQIADGCYANCDGSTMEPILTVDDFTCFINEFASAQSLPHEQQVTHYANCDGSTTAPALTVDDFTCFINEFAQGCP